MPLVNVHSGWSSGDLIFHEALSRKPATGYNILTIGDDAVTIGDATNDIDFKWYGVTTGTFILDANAHTLTMTGIDVSLTGDLTIDTEDIKLGDGDSLEFGDATNGDINISFTDGTGLSVAGTASAENLLLGSDTYALNTTLKGTLKIGKDAAGHRVDFYGDTSGSSMVWADTENKLYFIGLANIHSVGTGALNWTGDATIGTSLTVNGNIAHHGATLGVDHSITVGENVVIGGNIELTGTMRGVGAAVFDSTMSIGGTLTSVAINASGTVTSTNTTAGFIASGAATDGLSITGACTDAIHISASATKYGLNISSICEAGIYYVANYAANSDTYVHGMKIECTRASDIIVGSSGVWGAQIVVNQGTGYTAKMAPSVYGLQVVVKGDAVHADTNTYPCLVETQSSGKAHTMLMVRVNSGGSLTSGDVVNFNTYENVTNILEIGTNATATSGIYFADNVGTGTFTSLIGFDARNSTNLLKCDYAAGCVAANTHAIDGHALQHILVVDIEGDTGYIPVLASVPA